ncbi:hypothetical protein SEA_ZIRINKA_62 [Gordonia phage Zirinka]|uniref:Uncharacterized protein n=1 Tax=Gordonia phage Zirinka TaxID=1887656 RepID=A0A1B3B250_9CAUD|nr:hypothetical protein SEA_ZIRINKA_62 [Gordonia phage Zirinka]AOE45060.1 hypothetical protein SEA_ZIRINKA_62 [Gordonia phage Zirinka]
MGRGSGPGRRWEASTRAALVARVITHLGYLHPGCSIPIRDWDRHDDYCGRTCCRRANRCRLLGCRSNRSRHRDSLGNRSLHGRLDLVALPGQDRS